MNIVLREITVKDLVQNYTNNEEKGVKMCKEYELMEKIFIKSIADTFRGVKMNFGRSMILVGGNGGSASQADHFVGELVGRFNGIETPIPAISLSSNSAVLTALANDYSYNFAFSLSLRAFQSFTGISLWLSTSGESKNIIEGIKEAKKHDILTFAITGNSESTVAKLADYSLNIKGSTQAVQERTLKVLHKIARELKSIKEGE